MYRTVFTDGAIGGFTPAGAFNLTFYATRRTLPKSILHDISPQGLLSEVGKPSADSKNGIIREIEVGLYMRIETAKEIYEFLKKTFESDGK